MSDMTQDFRRELLKLGIIAYKEQETLWGIAKRCARTTGVPLAAGGAAASAALGPGAAAGFLAGLAAGTVSCTAANLAYRSELRKLLDQ
jgi:hypothetical protein